MYDIVVVGGGPGGYAAALYAHNFGLNVALVEKERPGGTCLIRGCIPAKQWLHIAHVYATVKHASDFGVMASAPEMDWDAALAVKTKSVETLVGGLGGLLKKRKVDVITGYGRLDGSGKVKVDTDEGQKTVEGRAVILASGSHARTIPGYQIDGNRIVTSDHALDWPRRPNRVAIIGGGVIGCEFASLLTDFDAEVHVFEMMDQILPGTDPDVARQLTRQLSRRGVSFHTGVGVGPAEIGEHGVRVPYGDEAVEVDVVLVAVGRGPNTDDVGLDTTTARVDRGFVEVDRATMQTAQEGLYAVGDIVAGTPQLAHVGFAEGMAAVTHIATGKTTPVDYRAIPRVTYTHPEVAEVGLTEAQAKEQGEVEVTKHNFNGIGRAIIIGENQGFVKTIAMKDGPIVGASVVGPSAGELIHELMYSVGWEALPAEAAAFVHAHPTLSETVGETLQSAAGKSLH
ncbi:MAG TPA: dihydrolipoyl dehydrogenase [Acidimicrobiia bacterium]|nr:dihydrolipoyl dehydrogenase [Acidimicrobiia bacterium]